MKIFTETSSHPLTSHHHLSPVHRYTRSPLLPLLLLVFLLHQGPARTTEASEVRVAAEVRALTGAHTRLVWCQVGDGSRRSRKLYKIMSLDTDDGQGSQSIWSTHAVCAKPLITPDGDRVIFSNRSNQEVYIINWNGSHLRRLIQGYATDVWKDPQTGIEWVYVRVGDGKMNNAIWRYQVENPGKSELVWDKTPLDAEDFVWFQVSADGKHAGGAFPWPRCGVANLPNGTFQTCGLGCWPSLSPDSSRFFHFDGAHKHAMMYRVNGGGQRAITLNQAPGINGSTVFFPRWTKEMRFLTMTGPSYMENSELYLGRFNNDFSAIDQWVQVTRNHVPDNWGDAWIVPGLGDYEGKAPFTVQIPGDKSVGEWVWDYGDGVRERAFSGRHTYRKPGTYAVIARNGDLVRKGWVRARPALSPEVSRVRLLDDSHILVTFTEPVQLKNPRVSLEGKDLVKRWSLGGEDLQLLVALKESLKGSDWLDLDGVYDKAQVPNRLDVARFPVLRPVWPGRFDNLEVLWETGNQSNFVYNGDRNETLSLSPVKEGQARLDRNGAMLLQGGCFHSNTPGSEQILLNNIRGRQQFSVEATIQPDNLRQGGARGPGMIFYYGSRSAGSQPGVLNFWLGQDKDKLVCGLRTVSPTGSPLQDRLSLCTLPNAGPHHVVVSYQPGRLLCCLDGKPVMQTNRIKGRLLWHTLPLCFGLDGEDPAGSKTGLAWHGKLEGIAIYSRFMEAGEAAVEESSYFKKLAARKPIPQLELRARLVARSKVPGAAQIAPYKNALVVDEYQVEKVLKGNYAMPKIRVAQWGLLDRQQTQVAQERVGGTYHLVLEPFEAHPELEPELLRDELSENYDLSLYFDVGDE